uniref:Uncharacterized protein n=1 Tax=Caudovirales sp. ct0jG3 TaxID=2825756 RepID=A0A8S5NU16_9CAUD|nr:MAG TPA: hypothetical protein [Caudovirales sp. ct0jG3]
MQAQAQGAQPRQQHRPEGRASPPCPGLPPWPHTAQQITGPGQQAERFKTRANQTRTAAPAHAPAHPGAKFFRACARVLLTRA